MFYLFTVNISLRFWIVDMTFFLQSSEMYSICNLAGWTYKKKSPSVDIIYYSYNYTLCCNTVALI